MSTGTTFACPRVAAASLAIAIAGVVFTFFAACGGSDDEGPGPGETVWSAEVRRLTIASSSGAFTPSPPGSECGSGAAEHTLDIATLHLTSVLCATGAGGPFRKVEQARDLTAAEMQELEPALARLVVVEEMTCGADKPEITLAITTDAGTREYRDSFYSCVDDPRPTVASAALDDVLHRLSQLAAP